MDIATVLRIPAGAPHAPERLAAGALGLDEIWQRLPLGAYTTLRTFDGCRLIRLDDHLDRLEHSARLAGAPAALHRPAVRRVLSGLLPLAGGGEARVRLLLAYGDAAGDVYVGVDPLRPPVPEKYELGVRCVTCDLSRPNPRSKSSAFIGPSRRARASLPPGVEEALMVGLSGELLEGLTSNFFAWRAGALWTADDGILIGITRAIVLEQARAAGHTVHLSPVRRADAATLDEAFITSSTRGVLPVVAIDGTTIGRGVPGPLARDRARRVHERHLGSHHLADDAGQQRVVRAPQD